MKTFSTLAASAAALALGLAVSGHAAAQDTTVPPAPPADTATPAAEPAPPATTPAQSDGTTPAPSASAAKGHIVFFRPSRLAGAIYAYHIVEVGDDGKPAKDAPHLGDLRNGGAFSYDVEPGIHSYNITGPMAVNKAEDRLRMEVEPGETYYVEQTVRMGLVTGGFRLVPADETRFHAAKVKLAEAAK